MTHLRKMMLEELQRRNYSEATTRCYLPAVEDFSRHFHCSPDRLGPRHIREYQSQLFQKRKLSPSAVTQRLAALRFFYIKTLQKSWSIAETPYPKKGFRLPTILSQQEVARLIDAALTPFHRILLMTLYATGLRRAELAHLKVRDVDSQRMVIHVQGGNHRLVSLAEENVTFRWRDSAHHNEQKLLNLPLDEFLRRFLLHLLPKGFVRIRHFGFLSHRRRATTLPLCFQLLGSAPQPQATPQASPASANDLWFCPKCGGAMAAIERFTSAEIQLRSPPLPVTVAA